MNIEDLSDYHLEEMLSRINAEICKRKPSKKVLVECIKVSAMQKTMRAHYNGGWFKTITGIDKTKTDGYSILGDFFGYGGNRKERPSGSVMLPIGSLILDCSIEGSRNNPYKKYFLYRIIGENQFKKLGEVSGDNWAVQLWCLIEAKKTIHEISIYRDYTITGIKQKIVEQLEEPLNKILSDVLPIAVEFNVDIKSIVNKIDIEEIKDFPMITIK